MNTSILIKDKRGYYRMTRLADYLRYKNVIKPLNDFIDSLEKEEEQKEN